jgi:hypothetical protein
MPSVCGYDEGMSDSGIVRLNDRLETSWLEAVDHLDGLDVRCLRAGDTLVLQTCHSHYTLHMVDPSEGRARARGSGKFLEDESPVRLLGATLTGRGSMVRVGVVMAGFKVVLQLSDGELMTSKVRRIYLNGLPLDASEQVH